MQFLPLATELLNAIVSRPARRRSAARTVLWAVAGVLLAIGIVFALIGLHALLAEAMEPVAASFVMALAMFLAGGLLALGAWLAAPPRPPYNPEHEIALILAGFLQGISGNAERSARTRADTKESPDNPDH